LRITPDFSVLKDNDYKIIVNAELTGEQIDYETSIDLIVHKKFNVFDYWWVLAILAVITALFVFFKRKQTYYESDSYEADDEDYVEEFESRFPWKKLLVGLLVLLIIGTVFVGSWYMLSNRKTIDSEPVEQEELVETVEEFDEFFETQPSIVEIDLSGYPGVDNEIITDGSSIVLNMTISNPSNESAVFTAETSDDTWITVKEPSIELAAFSYYTTQVEIIPQNSILRSRDYTLSVTTDLQGKDIDYSQEIELIIKKDRSFFSTLWFYLLLGLIIALIGIFFVSKEEDEEEVYEIESEKQTKNQTKKRTKIHLKK
jgi:hypothetical protein